MPYLPAGVVIKHNDKRPRKISGVTSLILKAVEGSGRPRNLDITISFNINDAYIIGDNEMMDTDLLKNMVHWAFKRTGTGTTYDPEIIDTYFNYSNKHKITNTTPVSRNSTYTQDFSLVQAKVGGAGPRGKRKSAKKKK